MRLCGLSTEAPVVSMVTFFSPLVDVEFLAPAGGWWSTVGERSFPSELAENIEELLLHSVRSVLCLLLSSQF